MILVTVYPIRGFIQHYSWGGAEFLPGLLSLPNTTEQSWAEYWLGVHPKGTASVLLPEGEQALDLFLDQHPEYLGARVKETFGELPFLFKVLDVRDMLSIQLHPEKEAAARGFAREEQAGIPSLAAHRNYKDKNHKPEVMVALTDFWLLHGFQSLEAIRATLDKVPAWGVLIPILDKDGVRALYEHIMQLPQPAVDTLLQPLYDELSQREALLEPAQADYWAWKAFEQYTTDGHHDRGIFSIYWFNLVELKPGEGIFQAARVPHAYLRGVNVELMANSDNVLRGGLTPKHIDVPELLANIHTEAVVPHILKGTTGDQPHRTHYEVPVPDFSLTKFELRNGDQGIIDQNNGPAIYLVLEGEVRVNKRLFKKGEAFLIANGGQARYQQSGRLASVIYAAGVGETTY